MQVQQSQREEHLRLRQLLQRLVPCREAPRAFKNFLRAPERYVQEPFLCPLANLTGMPSIGSPRRRFLPSRLVSPANSSPCCLPAHHYTFHPPHEDPPCLLPTPAP